MKRAHVEDLFEAMRRFQSDMRKAVTSPRLAEEARDRFKQWCADNGLDLDFTERG